MAYEDFLAGQQWTNLPSPQFGGGLLDAPTNRYQQIMSQMGGGDNYVVPTTTGGYVPSIYDITPVQNQAIMKFNAAVNQRLSGGGGTAAANVAAQQAAAQAALAQMTPGEQAALQAMTVPNLVNLMMPFPIKVLMDVMGIDAPGVTSSGGVSKSSASPMMGIASKGTKGQVANAVTTANNAAAAGGKGSGPGGATGNVGIGMGATSSGLGTGIGASVGGIGGGLYMGGKVTKDKMMQPDPNGPDDGYVALQDGEYVIKKKSVDKYGHSLLHALNSGSISKKKTKGLLET
jgi:hypothetical protein